MEYRADLHCTWNCRSINNTELLLGRAILNSRQNGGYAMFSVPGRYNSDIFGCSGDRQESGETELILIGIKWPLSTTIANYFGE